MREEYAFMALLPIVPIAGLLAIAFAIYLHGTCFAAIRAPQLCRKWVP